VIYNALATTDEMNEVFSDISVIESMLGVEAALARAQATLGIIPPPAGESIAAAAATVEGFDAAVLARDARQSGTMAIPLVDALRAKVRAVAPSASEFVHFGATSQDIVDTAFVRLIARACVLLRRDHEALAASLRDLSDRHASDVMLGRTLLQPALPITFGLKAAGWFAGVTRCWNRLDASRAELSVLQFGGPVGTLSAFGDRGLPLADALAEALELSAPAASWHGYGDRPAHFVAACGTYVGTLGKIARDISLLMQPEIAEVAEPGGGSSSMPHKRNPSGCAIALAAAGRLPGLVSTLMSGLVQEHERSLGAWHAQWTAVVDAVQTTGSSLSAMRGVAEGLTVHPDRMRANLDATRTTIPSSAGPADHLGAAEALRRRLLKGD
jgi:3-carboxy-cis,cis-muconate cycloisomerase